jgi:beta-galactosidase
LLSVDRPEIRADGLDLAFVTVAVADAAGDTVPRSSNLVEFLVEGTGEIVAVGNGNAASHEPFQASKRSAYNGLCLAIVRAKAGQPGSITVKPSSSSLKAAEIRLKSR